MLVRTVSRALTLACLAAAAIAVAGCGREDASGSSGDVRVVATTLQAADLVRNVGGERVSVHPLLQPNADPHDYEPRPSDARAIAEADLVVRSGGDIDAWLGDLLDNAGGDAKELTLIDHVEQLDDDPHWWQDPLSAIAATGAIRDALAETDPDGAAAYRRNADAYVAKLERLDSEIARCMARVPAGDRKLVTTHDSLRYFARRYELKVLGALIPSLSAQAQPSAGEVDRLVRQIEAEDVKAIFPESALNPKLERAVARETGAKVAGKLYADSLAAEGDGPDTYAEAMAYNARVIVDGITGGEQHCSFTGS